MRQQRNTIGMFLSVAIQNYDFNVIFFFLNLFMEQTFVCN